MNFSRDTFTANLGINIGNTDITSNTPWERFNGSDDDYLNKQLSYSKNHFNYRTWSPETSTLPTDLGLIVSCKIDFENGVGDDHIILIVGFLKVAGTTDPTVNFIQASVQFYGDDDKNIMIDPIKSDPNNPNQDLGQALYNALNDQISAYKFGTDGKNNGRNNLPDIAKDNLNAMKGDSVKSIKGAVSA